MNDCILYSSRRMESASSVDRTNSREGDQANYFYVVWPEETVTTLSAGGAMDPTLASSQMHRSAVTQRHPLPQSREQQILPQQGDHQMMEHSGVALSPPAARLSEIEVGGFASPLTSPILSIADTSPLVTQSAAVQTSPVEKNKIASRKQLELETNERNSNKISVSEAHHEGSGGSSAVSQSSYESSGGSQPNSPRLLENSSSQSTSSTAGLQNGGGKGGSGETRGQGTCNRGSPENGGGVQGDSECSNLRKRSRMQYYSINGCLECEVKDAEIRTLRRRIQVMEEVVALLNQKLTAIQQSSNGLLFSPMVMPPVVSQVVIPSSCAAPPTTSVKPFMYPSGTSHESSLSLMATPPHVPSDNEDASSDSASIAYAQPELCPSAEHRVELIAGSGIYVTLPRLEEARREAKNGTQLARKLMDAFWDRETLARSSLSSKSKYQYQQLDPNVISTIEAYCLSFDSNTHSRDLHACMTDKCCQARSRRVAPYKREAAALHASLQQNGVVQNGLHNGIDGT